MPLYVNEGVDDLFKLFKFVLLFIAIFCKFVSVVLLLVTLAVWIGIELFVCVLKFGEEIREVEGDDTDEDGDCKLVVLFTRFTFIVVEIS